jgi:hypothetical protein
MRKRGYDEHRYMGGGHGIGATPATMQMLEVEDAHEEGEEGAEDAEDVPPSSKSQPPKTTGKMGMAGGATCGFRGCGYAAKDHGLMAKHRLSSHGLK